MWFAGIWQPETVISPNPTRARRSRSLLPAWLAVLTVVAVAVNLRPGATSVGPVLTELETGIGMRTGTAAMLAALPAFCFSLFGAVSARLGARLGTLAALLWAMVLVTVGLLIRAVSGSEAGFLVFSVVALAGMAIGNVLLPVLIKGVFPTRNAEMMTVYATTLSVGAISPPLVAPLLAGSSGTGWRSSLGIWGLVGAGAVVVLVVAWLEGRSRPSAGAGHAPSASAGQESSTSTGQESSTDVATGILTVLRTPRGVALAVFFGVQSIQAYTMFGWLPQIYRDGGLGASSASLLLAVFNICGLFGGLLMPWVVHRVVDLRTLITVFTVLLVLGYLGLWLAPARMPLLWTIMLGVAGWAFPLALALITARTRRAHITAQLSAATQALGYLIAGLGTWLFGGLYGLTGGWMWPLLALMASGVLFLVAGIVASRPGTLDDEL